MTAEDLARSMDDIQGRYNQGLLNLEELIKAAVDLGRMYERKLTEEDEE